MADRQNYVGYTICGLGLALDGFDNLLLGLIIPVLIDEWGVSRETFAPFVIITVIMMSIGTAVAGWLGDRVGRKPTLVGSLLIMGVLTFASAFAQTADQLLVLRAIAALGLGGAMPGATALFAEFTPSQHRGIVVSMGMGFIPLGGLVAGLLGSVVLPAQGWRAMFIIGGIITLTVAILAIFFLRESPEFRTRAGASGSQDGEGTPVAGRPASIFSPYYLRDTIALWFCFFFCMLGVYSMMYWTPSLLKAVGYDISLSSIGLGAFNLGGVVGAIGIAAIIDRKGSRGPLISVALGGTLAALALAFVLIYIRTPVLVVIGLAAIGVFIAGLQTSLFVLATHIYPPSSRSTGVGGALGFGRMGAIASSISGTVVLGLGAPYFLAFVGITSLFCGLACAVIVRHVVGSARTRPAVAPIV